MWGKAPATLLSHLRQLFRSDHLVLLVLALVIGAASGYGAIGFRELYLAVQWGAFGTRADTLFSHVQTLPVWMIVLVPAAGGLVVGLLVRYVMPDGRPQGVADVMEAVALRSGRMGTREGLGAAAISAVSIGAGASVGREGPVVHLGASIGSWISDRMGLSRSQSVTLLGCGVAAAISASFNAPIAGVFFALEVVIGHYALSAFGPIVIASVFGTMISRIHFGNFPAFIVPTHPTVSLYEFPAFALLGVVSAVAAIIFLRSIDVTQSVVNRVPVPAWLRPAGAGLLVGVIALAFPQVLGVGYETTDAAINGEFPLWLLLALVVAKTAATAISLGSGFGGGVFSPSLFVGAMVGGAFGIIATQAFPELSSGHSAYTMVGMGAVAGSVLGAPISTILIIFELTADYTLTIAVMVAVVVASVITQQSIHRSFFTGQLRGRGISLTGGRERGLLNSIRVRDLMSERYAAVSPAATMSEIREKLLSAPYGELFAVDGEGGLVGTITLSDLSETAFDTSLDAMLCAKDVARMNPPCLNAGDGIERALTVMRTTGEEHLAVVADRETMKLVGFVHQVDVMQAYHRALVQARREERGEI